MFKANPNRSFSSLGEFGHWSYGCSMAFTGSSIIKSHNKFALVSLSKILVQQGCFWVPNVKITTRFWRKPQTYLSNLSIWKIYFIWSLWLINYWHPVAPSIWQQLDETFLLTYTDVTSFKHQHILIYRCSIAFTGVQSLDTNCFERVGVGFNLMVFFFFFFFFFFLFLFFF